MSKKKKSSKNQPDLSVFTQEAVTKLENNRLSAIATNPSLEDHTGPNSYRLVFESYNHSHCEIAALDAQLCQKLIERFQEITKLDHTRLLPWSKGGQIKRTGEYNKLYKNLGNDVVLYEKAFGSAARLFFYTVGNFFCIVSINKTHFK